MLVEIFTWVAVGIIAGLFVGLSYPGPKNVKNIIGSIMAGVFGASVAGAIYKAVEISEITLNFGFGTVLLFILAVLIFGVITTASSKIGND
ncbi:MAG: hypothetical protein PHW75_00740 [Patescibacteria group bacterium]|nr:hypothetical protein [Patescibacteria group bacterium]